MLSSGCLCLRDGVGADGAHWQVLPYNKKKQKIKPKQKKIREGVGADCAHWPVLP